MPSGTTPSRTSRQKAIRSLRAKATIMSCASTGAFSVRCSKPLRQGTVLLEHEKSPCQLDHASPNSSVARTRQPLLPAFCAAFVGRASETGITRYSPSVAHVSRQHLLHQHVGRLDTNADHAGQQAHHCMWSLTGRLLDMLEPHRSISPDLITYQPMALHIALAAQPTCSAGLAHPRACANLRGARRPSSVWD